MIVNMLMKEVIPEPSE